jgi:hypothetical protein
MQYPNGDNIKLPEILTDSEDEDYENNFEQPGWTNTLNLHETLKVQELIDPESVFGPIEPFEMEKVFRNIPKRVYKRTSSANWAHDVDL